MKRKISTTLFALCCIALLQAQNSENEVRKIRLEYNSIKSKIETLQKEEYAGAFYCLHLTDNVYNKSYPASGTYIVDQYFYYDQGEKRNWQLYMLVESSKISDVTIYTECMYQEGELAFVFTKSGYDDNMEKRLYLSGGKAIRYTENNKERNINSSQELIESMRSIGENYLELFNSIKISDNE